MKIFAGELFNYVHSRRSPRLKRQYFLSLCFKYPQEFDDSILIFRNKELLLISFLKK